MKRKAFEANFSSVRRATNATNELEVSLSMLISAGTFVTLHQTEKRKRTLVKTFIDPLFTPNVVRHPIMALKRSFFCVFFSQLGS